MCACASPHVVELWNLDFLRLSFGKNNPCEPKVYTL